MSVYKEGDVKRLRKTLAFIICICMLIMPVKAVEQDKQVALTFDDGPSGKFTRRLLEGLEERGVKATFLLCGYRMEQYPALTEQIIENGHEIGLHGYSHKPMHNMRYEDVVLEIQKSLELLPENCNINFLRPPGGFCQNCLESAAKEFGLSILHWSVDPKDWAVHDAQVIKKSVINQVRDGDVILLHDMSDSSVNAALAIIDALQKQGFQFVTASELANFKSTELVPGKKYTRFEHCS